MPLSRDNIGQVSRPRTFVGVDEIPFVAGNLCLDFVNTSGARESAAPRERLTSYQDLLLWSRRAGVLDPGTGKRLRRAAAHRQVDAERALRRVRALRERLHQLFLGVAEGRHASTTLLVTLDRLWRAARNRQILVSSEGGFEIRFASNTDDLDRMFWPIVVSAVELLTSERLRALRRCAECDWLFLDESKNGSRRWCKATCGNRARSRKRYDRTRERTSKETIRA
jgi:predicted RNA-binding Zn ribbon-like protein